MPHAAAVRVPQATNKSASKRDGFNVHSVDLFEIYKNFISGVQDAVDAVVKKHSSVHLDTIECQKEACREQTNTSHLKR